MSLPMGGFGLAGLLIASRIGMQGLARKMQKPTPLSQGAPLRSSQESWNLPRLWMLGNRIK